MSVYPLAWPRIFYFVRQKTADEMRIGKWSSDVCSSDLPARPAALVDHLQGAHQPLVALLLGQAANLGLHRLVGLTLEQAGGRPVDEAEKHRQGNAQKQQVEQSDAEDRGLEQPVHRGRFWT